MSEPKPAHDQVTPQNWFVRYAAPLAVALTVLTAAGTFISRSSANESAIVEIRNRQDVQKSRMDRMNDQIEALVSDIAQTKKQGEDTNQTVHEILDDLLRSKH
jgi:septal ring factor EnvC (AmiA/AmiB activator)